MDPVSAIAMIQYALTVIDTDPAAGVEMIKEAVRETPVVLAQRDGSWHRESETFYYDVRPGCTPATRIVVEIKER